jgi:hypothetical protein
MSDLNAVGPVQEYQTLRQELLESRKYVFERPLLILTAGVAGLNSLKSEYVPLLPIGLGILILFNLEFTVNRLLSAARIVAYIQLELEERYSGSWKGWETCLREFRRWIKLHSLASKLYSLERKKPVDPDFDEGIGDALMYYPAIFNLHVGLMLIAMAGSAVLAGAKTWLTLLCLATSILLGAWFAHYCWQYRPSFIKTMLERDRVIWKHVLNAMTKT